MNTQATATNAAPTFNPTKRRSLSPAIFLDRKNKIIEVAKIRLTKTIQKILIILL
ncbi:MAG: hypothetical protein FWE01_03335 [Firmicutes bacterium]|nr:hypothetical protein [Bacillota bacterium]